MVNEEGEGPKASPPILENLEEVLKRPTSRRNVLKGIVTAIATTSGLGLIARHFLQPTEKLKANGAETSESRECYPYIIESGSNLLRFLSRHASDSKDKSFNILPSATYTYKSPNSSCQLIYDESKYIPGSSLGQPARLELKYGGVTLQMDNPDREIYLKYDNPLNSVFVRLEYDQHDHKLKIIDDSSNIKKPLVSETTALQMKKTLMGLVSQFETDDWTWERIFDEPKSSNNSQIPKIPDAPQVPKVPIKPKIPDIPQIPHVPHISTDGITDA